jgi:hypothetical protein
MSCLTCSSQNVALRSCLPASWCFPRNASTAIAFLLCWRRCRGESTVGLGVLPRDVANVIARLICPVHVGKHQKMLRQRIVREWKKLASISRVNCQYRFVRGFRSLPSHDTKTFCCVKGLCLGVSREAVSEWDTGRGVPVLLREWPLESLRSWCSGEKTITLFCVGESAVVFETGVTNEVATLLTEYDQSRIEAAEQRALWGDEAMPHEMV